MKNSAALAALAMLAACGELPAEQTAEQTGVAEVEPADVTTVTNRIDEHRRRRDVHRGEREPCQLGDRFPASTMIAGAGAVHYAKGNPAGLQL